MNSYDKIQVLRIVKDIYINYYNFILKEYKTELQKMHILVTDIWKQDTITYLYLMYKNLLNESNIIYRNIQDTRTYLFFDIEELANIHEKIYDTLKCITKINSLTIGEFVSPIYNYKLINISDIYYYNNLSYSIDKINSEIKKMRPLLIIL